MKLVYWLAPCIAVTAFAGYYHHWNSVQFIEPIKQPPAPPVEKPRVPPPDEYEGRDGASEATADLASGKMTLFTYGRRAADWPEQYFVLKYDYNIEFKPLAGDLVSEARERYINAYNAVVKEHIVATLGATVFEEANRKAGALYATRRVQAP